MTTTVSTGGQAADPAEVYTEAMRTLVRAAADYLRSETGLALPVALTAEEGPTQLTLSMVTAHGAGLVRLDLADSTHCASLTLDRVPLDRAAQLYRTVWGEDHEHFDGGSTLDGADPGTEFEWEDDNDDAGRRTYDPWVVRVLNGGQAQLDLPDLRLCDVVHGVRSLTSR